MKTTAAIFAILALTGCTIERTVVQEPATTIETTQPKTTPAPTQPPSQPSSFVDEAGFINANHQQSPMTILLDDQDLLDAGYSTCIAFQSGMEAIDIVIAINNSAEGDPDVEDMLQWIAVHAVVYLCPEFSFIMDEMT